MTELEAALVIILMVLCALLLPAKYDPAIKLKEWYERKSGDL